MSTMVLKIEIFSLQQPLKTYCTILFFFRNEFISFDLLIFKVSEKRSCNEWEENFNL